MIIGLCGLAGSGKDTVAEYLGYKRFSFASKIKDTVAVLFDWDRKLLEGDTKESREWRETPVEHWRMISNSPITPREVLQKFGTESIRNVFTQDFWINSLKQQLKATTVNVVITDCRFPNEIKMIQELGGDVYWIQRGELPEWVESATREFSTIPFTYKKEDLVNLPMTGYPPMYLAYPEIHPSEYSWLGTNFTDVICNQSNLENLYLEIDKKIISRYNSNDNKK